MTLWYHYFRKFEFVVSLFGGCAPWCHRHAFFFSSNGFTKHLTRAHQPANERTKKMLNLNEDARMFLRVHIV